MERTRRQHRAWPRTQLGSETEMPVLWDVDQDLSSEPEPASKLRVERKEVPSSTES